MIIFALLTFIYISWLCGHKPTACLNSILTSLTSEDRFLYLIYFVTTYLHLAAIVLMFSCFRRGTVNTSSIFNFIGSPCSYPWSSQSNLACDCPRTVFYIKCK